MARRYEGSAKDERQDARGARAMGVSRRDYEKSSRDKREDAAGQKKLSKGVKRFDSGGSVSDSGSGSSGSGSSDSSASGLSGYYNMMAQMRGNLGGSKQSPYSNTQGGNSYFSKGGPVGSKTGAKAKRKRK